MSKYYYNKDYFEIINTEEKAYWLGFLYADGCINQKFKDNKLKSMNLELCLCENDENHLIKFLKSIESNVPITNKKCNLNQNTYLAKRLFICCTKLCKDLIDKGCVPNKSLILKFPSNYILDNNLLKHFIRGYFDGDGCVSINKNNIIQINFVGTYEMLKGISFFFIIKQYRL